MDKAQPDTLDKETFVSKVVPFFEESKSKLLALLGDDEEWLSFLSGIRLVYIDNSATDRDSYLYLTSEADDNLYLADSDPLHQYYGFSSRRITEGYVYISLIDCLRDVFVDELVSRATPWQIAEYFRQLLESNYRSVGYTEQQDYIRLWVPNLQFSGEEPLFAISAYGINIIIPIAEALDANRIEDTTAGNKKILLTNRRDIESHCNFDQVLNILHLAVHFSTVNFISGIPLYRQVLERSYSQVFEIIDLLRTTGYSEIYELKKQLVNLDLSDGKAFEDYLHQFLLVCFGPHFEDIDIRRQVPNRGRLRIRDFVIVNNNSSSPFLRSLKAKGVDFLLFDAKNYADELSTRDFDTFREYLRENQYFGNFGVILSRNGASENAKESVFRGLSQGIKVVVLDETDLLLMLERIGSGKDAVDALENKYNELLLQL